MHPNANETFTQFLSTIDAFGPRLFASLIAGMVLGLEGQIYEKPAGLRTGMLICLSTCLITIISIITGQTLGGDSSRITAQIVTGIGFLGAGVILRQNDRVRGITTAASIFGNAAVGITIGSGYIFSGVAIALLTFALLIFIKPIDNKINASKWATKLRELDRAQKAEVVRRAEFIEELVEQGEIRSPEEKIIRQHEEKKRRGFRL